MSPAASPDAAVRDLAVRPVVLVACDYDGTLSAIVDDPSEATPHPEAIRALLELTGLADTHVAVVSGRSLQDLAGLSGLEGVVRLVGSHGLEFDDGSAPALSDDQLVLRSEVIEDLEEIAQRYPGALSENKPAGVAFHYRNVDVAHADDARCEVLDGPATRDGVHLKTGKMVVELAVTTTHKGEAIERLRREVGADAVLFVGDDVTDEDAFAVMRGSDLGVKVGPGSTAATARVDDLDGVAAVLATLGTARRTWLDGLEENAG